MLVSWQILKIQICLLLHCYWKSKDNVWPGLCSYLCLQGLYLFKPLMGRWSYKEGKWYRGEKSQGTWWISWQTRSSPQALLKKNLKLAQQQAGKSGILTQGPPSWVDQSLVPGCLFLLPTICGCLRWRTCSSTHGAGKALRQRREGHDHMLEVGSCPPARSRKTQMLLRGAAAALTLNPNLNPNPLPQP